MTFYDGLAERHRTSGHNQTRRLLADADVDRLRLALAITDDRLSQLAQPAPAFTDHRALDARREGTWELEGARRAITELIEENQS